MKERILTTLEKSTSEVATQALLRKRTIKDHKWLIIKGAIKRIK